MRPSRPCSRLREAQMDLRVSPRATSQPRGLPPPPTPAQGASGSGAAGGSTLATRRKHFRPPDPLLHSPTDSYTCPYLADDAMTAGRPIHPRALVLWLVSLTKPVLVRGTPSAAGPRACSCIVFFWVFSCYQDAEVQCLRPVRLYPACLQGLLVAALQHAAAARWELVGSCTAVPLLAPSPCCVCIGGDPALAAVLFCEQSGVRAADRSYCRCTHHMTCSSFCSAAAAGWSAPRARPPSSACPPWTPSACRHAPQLGQHVIAQAAAC